jgi:exodeoxyribonuclease VII large subunit
MEIYNKPEFAEILLNKKKPIVTAIGHKIDKPLFEKIADKHFATPSLLGAYLKEIYSNTIEELIDTKAQLQKTITIQLKEIHDKELQIKEHQIKVTKEQSEMYKAELKQVKNEIEKMKNKQVEVTTPKTDNTLLIIIIIIAIIIVLFLLNKK